MSFQMTHLEIAYRVAKKLGITEGLPEFILGSVAPDCVHFREDYEIGHKVHSHLFEGCGVWSNTQDYDRWISNINEFFDRFAKDEEDVDRRMFAMGICVHCITDYWNDLYIWRALQKEHIPPMTLEEFRSEYYPEAQTVDKWLFQNSENAKEIVTLLQHSKELDFSDYIYAKDQVKMKDHLINTQYNLPKPLDVSGYKYYPSDKILWFTEVVSDKVFEYLKARIDRQ